MKSSASGLFAWKWYVRGHITKLRFANFRAMAILFLPVRAYRLPIKTIPPSHPKGDAAEAMLPVRRRSRSRNRADEGICGANSPRRSERPNTMALAETQAIMLGGLKTQSHRLITLGNMVRQGNYRQTRLEQTASNIADSIQTGLAKIDTPQQQKGLALSPHEQTLLNHQPAKGQMESLDGQTSVQQEQTHGRQLSDEEELARTQKLLQQALYRPQSTQQVMMERQLAHGQETLALQKAAPQQSLAKAESIPPRNTNYDPIIHVARGD